MNLGKIAASSEPNETNYERARLCLFEADQVKDVDERLVCIAASQTFALLAVCDILDRFTFNGRGGLRTSAS